MVNIIKNINFYISIIIIYKIGLGKVLNPLMKDWIDSLLLLI